MSQALMAEVLEFLRLEQAADIAAMSALKTMTALTAHPIEWNESDEAIKTFRAREALIDRLAKAVGH